MRKNRGAGVGQLVLAGFETSSEQVPRDDLFFALQPSSDVIPAIMEAAQVLRSEYRLSGRMQRVDRLHVSLWGVRIPADQSEVLANTATRVAAQIRRNAVALSLNTGAANLGTELAAAMRVPGGAVATPHLTLAYDAQVVPEHAIEPICWTAREFVLIRNRVLSGRPYEILGRWPLCG